MTSQQVLDAIEVAKAINEFSLTPREYEQLTDDEVFKAETEVGRLVTTYKQIFTKISAELQQVVHDVFLKISEEATVRRARLDSNVFMEFCFVDDVTGEPFVQEELHKRWQATMNEQDQSLIIGPRGHGKSSQVVGYALWKLGVNSNLRIKIVSNTDTNASKRVGEIGEHIMTNEKYHRVFPQIHPAKKGQWNASRLIVKRSRVLREPSVEGYGVSASGTGGRCDLLILDDVVDQVNAISKPGMREVVKNAVLSDWLALLSKGGKVFSICTLWHKSDLNCHLGGDVLKNHIKFLDGKIQEKPTQKALEPGEWYVCFDAIDDRYTPICPSMWTEEDLKAMRRKIGRSAFNRGYRNRVVDDAETMIDPNWIVYYRKGDLPPREKLFIVQSYDLAISKNPKRQSSWLTCTTLAGHFKKDVATIYIMQSFRKRLPFPDQLKLVKSGYRSVKPDVILLEANAYQIALAQQLLDTTILPVVPIYSKVNKIIRLESCTPALEAGSILFSERLNPDHNAVLEERGDLVGELLDFPFGEHDDMVDGASQGIIYLQQYSSMLDIYDDFDDGGDANVYVLDAADTSASIEA